MSKALKTTKPVTNKLSYLMAMVEKLKKINRKING